MFHSGQFGGPQDGPAAVAVGQAAIQALQAAGEGRRNGERGIYVIVLLVDGDDGVAVEPSAAVAAELDGRHVGKCCAAIDDASPSGCTLRQERWSQVHPALLINDNKGAC